MWALLKVVGFSINSKPKCQKTHKTHKTQDFKRHIFNRCIIDIASICYQGTITRPHSPSLPSSCHAKKKIVCIILVTWEEGFLICRNSFSFLITEKFEKPICKLLLQLLIPPLATRYILTYWNIWHKLNFIAHIEKIHLR